jgi:hypothetical protein
VGLATHNPGGQVRFGVTATAASAVLYGAVVLLGVKEASPSVLDDDGDRSPAVVLIHQHDSAVPGPRQKLPQASPGPERQRTQPSQHSTRIGIGSRPNAPRPASAPAQPTKPAPSRATESKPSKPATTAPAPSQTLQPMLEVTPPPLPVPEVTLPPVTVPSPLLPLPETPALPQLPGASDLPG